MQNAPRLGEPWVGSVLTLQAIMFAEIKGSQKSSTHPFQETWPPSLPCLPQIPLFLTCQTLPVQSHLSFSKGQRQSFWIPCGWRTGGRYNAACLLENCKARWSVIWLLVVRRPGWQVWGPCRTGVTAVYLKTEQAVPASNLLACKWCGWLASLGNLPPESATWLLPATMLRGHDSWLLPPLRHSVCLAHRLRV